MVQDPHSPETNTKHHYEIRAIPVPRVSFEVGPRRWRSFQYFDIKEIDLDLEENDPVLSIRHVSFLITIRGNNLRVLYNALLSESVVEIPIYRHSVGPVANESCAKSIEIDLLDIEGSEANVGALS
jgi:hypothetical protein